MSKSRVVSYLEALFAVVVWGGSFIATKIAVGQMSPVAVVWLRFAMGIPILGMAVFMRKQFTWPKPAEWGYFALLGFIGITFHQWLQSNGLQTAQATTTAWIVSTAPVFIAVLAWMVLKEKITLIQGAGVGVALIGVIVVVSKGNLANFFAGQFGVVGDFLIFISAINWAVFSILSRRGLKEHPSTLMTFWSMTLGWLFTTVAFFSQSSLGELSSLDSRGWIAMVFLGIFTTGLAYIAWFDALATLPATQTGAFLYIEPLTSMIVASIILSEKVTWASLVGGAVILFGVWLVNRE